MLQQNRQTIDHEGEQVFFSVSPCSWMYPNYGLQVGISLTQNAVNAVSEFIIDKGVEATNRPMQELDDAAKVMVEKWLSENGTKILHEKAAKWKVAAAEFAAESEKENKRMAAAQKRSDARHKAKGYTHRVDACIHPAHGDDYLTSTYVVCTPDKAQIDKILRSSVVKDDYVVTEL